MEASAMGAMRPRSFFRGSGRRSPSRPSGASSAPRVLVTRATSSAVGSGSGKAGCSGSGSMRRSSSARRRAAARRWCRSCWGACRRSWGG
uniref:Uncharacterized protein n=1 Tax=Arundo donax TaxID=35708 RepID=A0A0A9HBD8_ARUDO